MSEKILLVAGSRDLYEGNLDYRHIFDNASYVFDTRFHTIISGGARGIDRLAERWAWEKDYPFKEYPADWNTLGKRAGFVRNQEMVDACTHAIVVWDGESKGTRHTIGLLDESGKPYVLVRVGTEGDG